jgi:putative ABC transport system permease protein
MLGQRLKLTGDWLEIVGVAKDVKNRSLSELPRPLLYLPLLQDYRSDMILVARTSMNPEQVFHGLQTVVSSLDSGMPMFNVKTLEQHIGLSLYLERMAATLLSIFGLLALSLAALGLYGVMSYSVNQRTRELGIRISIGAKRRDVLKLVLGQTLVLAAVGIAGGLVTAIAVTRFAASLLYGISPADPATFTLIAVLLLLVSLVAGYFPARRATRIDPTIALRSE